MTEPLEKLKRLTEELCLHTPSEHNFYSAELKICKLEKENTRLQEALDRALLIKKY